MKTELFDYNLSPERIAQKPLFPRDASRLLIVPRNPKAILEEIVFSDIAVLLKKGDILIINDTRVMPARIKGYTILHNGIRKEVECLFLKNTGPKIWEIMCFPGERLKIGRQIVLENGMMLDVVGETYAGRLVKVPVEHFEWLQVLEQYGKIPLPPYITEMLENSESYQTVYAQHSGSTAAPTAGRHFTPELLAQIQALGVKVSHVTLHIGPGTFKPIYEETIDEYKIHSEFVSLPRSTIESLRKKDKESRIIAVGTTSMRSLESFAAGKFEALSDGSYAGETDLYITPGYQFKMVDALITNFHAPRTSLLVLVSAFMGYDCMKQAYHYALENHFRFLSFGDAMWVEKQYFGQRNII